jgi:glycosyltransferase involved in cell wall biosynthesis
MPERPLKVAWISYFPIEWLPELPEPLRGLPRMHPASWQRVLLQELVGNPGLELHICVVRKQFSQDFSFERDGVHFHCLKVPGGLRALSLFWWDTWRLGSCLKAIQPDLVHAWGTERAAALVASRLPYPYLVTMQGLLEWYSQHVPFNRVQKLEARLERTALRRASVVTCESSFGVRWLREHYPHLEVRQAEHASDWLFHRLERRPQARPLRFLFVGALAPIKGADLLVQALERLRGELDFELTLVGSGETAFLQQLKDSSSPALWERIRHREQLTPREVAEEMASATMVLFPTRVDTSPNSVKEAVVAGVPVVASSMGGIPDYVRPGQNGFLFAPGSLEDFVKSIRQAAAHPLFQQGRVDAATLEEMRLYLSPRVMAEKFMTLYRQLGA